MFCQNCGTKIQDEARFCFNCGFEVKQMQLVEQTTQKPSSDELDRDALKIYLGNVLALECSVNKLTAKINNLKAATNSLESNNCAVFSKYPLDRQHSTESFSFGYDGSVFYVLVNPNCRIASHSNSKSVWAPVEEVRPYLKSKDTFHDFTDVAYGSFFKSREAHQKLHSDFLYKLDKFKEYAPPAYEEKKATLIESKRKLEQCSKEMDDVKSILYGAYSIDIIPRAFRYNIYAIYYLHDFMTSSKLSFETALLHYDLAEIKSKLETIIERENDIIINQAIIQAQNQDMLSQQQRALSHLASIEKNTDRAAQYAKIAANNAEACAWISAAHYIKY